MVICPQSTYSMASSIVTDGIPEAEEVKLLAQGLSA